jgi:hypothetical protein
MISSFLISLVKTEKGNEFSIPIYSKGEWSGSDIMFDGEYNDIEIEGGSSVSDKVPTFTFDEKLTLKLNINNNIFFNYYGISYKSNSYLRGQITYQTVFSEITEEFFIEASSKRNEFYSFIDGYFSDKKARNVKQISFTNLSGSMAEIELFGIAVFNREKQDDTVFINDENCKIGVCLKWGGSLSYYE